MTHSVLNEPSVLRSCVINDGRNAGQPVATNGASLGRVALTSIRLYQLHFSSLHSAYQFNSRCLILRDTTYSTRTIQGPDHATRFSLSESPKERS